MMGKNKKKNSSGKQEKGVTVGVKSKGSVVTAPAAYGYKMPQVSYKMSSYGKDGAIRIVGTDYIGAVATVGAVSRGGVIRNDYLCPGGAMFDGTKLNKFASMYDKYVFKSVVFHYSASVGTSYAANLIMSFDKDYADLTPPPSDGAIRQFLSYQGAMSFPAWESTSMKTGLSDLQKFYYTNDTGYDGRLVYQGQLYFVAGSAVAAAQTLGNLYCTYEILLFDPQLESPVEYTGAFSSGTSVSGTAGAAWNNIPFVVLATGIKIIKDSSYNTGLYIPPGVYILEQIITAASASTTFNTPTVTPLISTLSAVITTLITTASSSGSTVRVDRLTIPTGGANVFSTLAFAAVLTNCFVRIVASDPGYMI